MTGDRERHSRPRAAASGDALSPSRVAPGKATRTARLPPIQTRSRGGAPAEPSRDGAAPAPGSAESGGPIPATLGDADASAVSADTEERLQAALPANGFAAPPPAAMDTLERALAEVATDELPALARRLDDPSDPLGRSFARLAGSTRHRLRTLVRHRASRAAGAPRVEAAAGDAALQRRESAAATPQGAPDAELPSIQSRAEAGIGGAGGSLPHQAAIRRAFGHHDIGHVEAHTGGEAATAAAGLGADAYATGHHVAFASAPDLHLAAHEAAHVVQQRGGVQLAGGVGQAGDPHERHADAVADRVVAGHSAEDLLDEVGGAGASAPVVQRRAGEGEPAPADPAAALRHELGLSITTAPAVGGAQRPYVGTDVEFGVHIERPPTDRAVRARSWGLDLPDQGTWRQVPTAPTTRLPITRAGAHRFWVRLVVGDTELELDRRFEAVEPSRRADELVAADRGLTMGQLRGQLALQQALLDPPGPDQQGTTGAVHIQTSATNPARRVEKDVSLLSYWVENREPAAAGAEPPRYHWYARPFRQDGLPDLLGSHPRVTAGDLGDAYDLGTGPVATLPASHQGTFLIVCRAEQPGKPPRDVRYLQSILGDEQLATSRKLAEHDERVTTLGSRLYDDALPLVASHVTTQTGAETTLRLYLSRARRDPSRWLLVDLTPGLDAEQHQLQYEGDTAAEVLTDFQDDNRYPTGAITLHVDPNDIGAPPGTHRFQTDGQTLLGTASGHAGLASLALLLGAGAAAIVTGGGSLLVTALVIGSAAAAATSGALSLADHLKSEKLDKTAVALDVLTIATSFLGGGLAAKALRSSPALLVASRGTRFLLWTNFTLEGTSALLIGVDGADQIAKILESNAPYDQQTRLLAAVISNLILTGALLAVSYGDLRSTRGRLQQSLRQPAESLTDADVLSLALLDDQTIQALQGAGASDLSRLAAILRDDPATLTRLPGRPDLLAALRKSRGAKARDLELAHAELRMRQAGLDGAALEKKLADLDAAAPDAAAVFALSDRVIESRSKRGPRRSGKAEVPEGFERNPPAGLPADLKEIREGLSEPAGRAFDEKWHRITKGSESPSEAHIDAFRGYLGSVEKKAGGDLGAGLEEAPRAVVGKAGRRGKDGHARGTGEPSSAASGTGSQTAPRQWVAAELQRRGITDPMFDTMADQTTGKVRTALDGDPIASAGRAVQQRAEVWSLEGSGNNPRQFANRYEYARARYLMGRDEANKSVRGQPGARASAAEAAAREISPERLTELLEQDNQTVRSLGPGQHLGPIDPGTAPEEIARRVQKLHRFAYESETAESYHAVKHREEMPPIGNETGNLVIDAAAAATDTIRTGEVVFAAKVEDAVRVIVRKAYRFGTPSMRATVDLEAILFIQPDGSVVLASYGRPKAKL